MAQQYRKTKEHSPFWDGAQPKFNTTRVWVERVSRTGAEFEAWAKGKRGDDMPSMMLFVFVIVCMLFLCVTVVYRWMPQKVRRSGGGNVDHRKKHTTSRSELA